MCPECAPCKSRMLGTAKGGLNGQLLSHGAALTWGVLILLISRGEVIKSSTHTGKGHFYVFKFRCLNLLLSGFSSFLQQAGCLKFLLFSVLFKSVGEAAAYTHS